MVLKDTAPHMMDKMMGVMDSVMAETIVSAEYDASDGIFKKSTEKDERLESKVKCNTFNESQKEKTEILEEF